jgi:glyoxylase-like metal-dependent hydrolase (beta-lactamase superfamily II)
MNKNTKLICVLTVVGVVSSSLSQQRTSESVEFKKISDKLFQIVGGRGAQGGAYIGDNGVIVIDAKMDRQSVKQVIRGLRQRTNKPIKYLVNTHSDGDHVTGNRYFPETVTFVAHDNCRQDFFRSNRRGEPSEWAKPELLPFVPSVTFTEKMELYLGAKKVELWYFGVGHTTGDIVVYFPEEKTAFIGDLIFLTRTQLIHSHKGGNSFQYVQTILKMLQTIDAERFCSGHSEMADRQAILSHIRQMEERQEKVQACVREGMSLEETQREFTENEARLVTSIYNEVNSGSS